MQERTLSEVDQIDSQDTPIERLEVPVTSEFEKSSPFIFAGSPEYFKLLDPEFQMTGLTYLTINTPTKCGLGCVTCALGSGENTTYTPGQLESRAKLVESTPQILERFSRLGTKQVVVIGEGEPTYEPKEDKGFQEIVQPLVESANKQGLGTTLFTTLTYWSPEKGRVLHDNNVSIMLSLHSLQPEVYRKKVTRGQPERVYENIESLTDLFRDDVRDTGGNRKFTRLGVNFTISGFNFGEVNECKQFAHEHGMQFIANTTMPSGRAEEKKTFNYDISGGQIITTDPEADAKVAEMYQLQKQKAIEVSDTHGQSSMIDRFCGFGRNGLAINTDGTMMICGYEPKLAENMPNIFDLMKLSDEGIMEFSKMMSDPELWDVLESPCVTRAEESNREIFMVKLKERVIEFNKKYGLES